MNIWDGDRLLVFIAFVIPGFIGLKVYELRNPRVHKDSSKQIIDAIIYSCINYAILFWPILVVERSGLRNTSPYLYGAFYFCVLVVAPVIWAFLWLWIRKWEIMQNIFPHPTQKPWDYIFSKRASYWAKVTLQDGTQIAGKFAENSFVSSSPAKEQIYLEETWIINDKGYLERKEERSAGVIIVSEIAYVELMTYSEEEQS